MGDKDAKTQRTNAFMKKLDIEHVGQYAVEKFIGSGRGAVAFNMNFPVPQVKGYGQFVWAPLAGLIKSEDDLLINTVSKYDPKREFVILYLLPAEDGLTVDIWMMTLFCTFPPHIVSLVRSAAVEHEQAWKEWRGEN
ncbi:hypothetical protein FRB90_007426 [Tulasnella sp. 427]|nr:hypothetical protein FRB90_007426 [Tulasnella sp. 427]